MQPLSVQAHSPYVEQREQKSLIPSSQGLLATTDTCPATQPPPVLPPSSSSAQNDSSPQVLGLKLLHHPSVMFQQRAPHTLHATNHETFGSCQPKEQAIGKKTSGGQKNVLSAATKHLSFNPLHNLTPRNPQPQMQESMGQFRPAFPTFPQAPVQGLRLRQLQDSSQSNITFPKLSLPVVSRPALISAPVTGAPMIKLLHIDTGPKMVSSPVVALRDLNLATLHLAMSAVFKLAFTADDAPCGSSSSNDPSHFRGRVNSFRNLASWCWIRSAAVGQSRSSYQRH